MVARVVVIASEALFWRGFSSPCLMSSSQATSLSSSGAVPAWHCSGVCAEHGRRGFDGINIGVMNYNDSALVLLNVLELGEDITITGRSSLLATTRALQQRLFDMDDTLPKFMSRELYRKAHWAYLWLRNDYEDAQPRTAAGYCCVVCGRNPAALIADGVSLGAEEGRSIVFYNYLICHCFWLGFPACFT